MAHLTSMTGTLKGLSQKAALIFRLQPFDLSTPESRAKERYRRVALTTMASGLAKAISLLTILISVPLTLGYLGTERYGLWMTISSVILMLSFADLGMGSGLMNTISEAHGRDDRLAALGYVSSGFFMLLGIAVLILAAFSLAYPFIPWPSIFNVKSELAAREAGPAMAAFVACFALNLPLGVVQRAQMGYQEGFLDNLWQGFGSVLGLFGMILVIYLQAGLLWLVLAVAGAPALASFLNGLVLFGARRPWLRPRWECVTKIGVRTIFRLGILFFFLQIGVALAYTSDNIVAVQVLGPEAVSQLSVASRLFSFPYMIMSMMLMPLWPAYGEALARGDLDWVRGTLKRSLWLTLIAVGLPSVLLIFFGAGILDLWVGPAIAPSFSLLLGLGIWAIMGALGHAVAMFFNGTNIIRFQVICGLSMAIIALVLKTFLAQRIGLPGIVWGTIISYFFLAFIPYSLYIKRLPLFKNT